jgi:putative endonuclease
MYTKQVLSKQQLGQRGETLARQYLERLGYTFVGSRFRTRYGESDLIMRDGDLLVFIEVKARRGYRQGSPEEAVTPWKLKNAIRAAEGYCQLYHYEGDWRIDVVTIAGGTVRHLRNVTL